MQCCEYLVNYEYICNHEQEEERKLMICTTGKPYFIFQESVVSLLWYIDGREGLILITRTCEHVTFYGKREFTGMIMVRIMKWGGLSLWGQCNHKGSYEKKAGRSERERQIGRCYITGFKDGG